MPAKKPKSPSKKQTARQNVLKNSQERGVRKTIAVMKNGTRDLLNRRPHRSFRRTRKRDYVRSLTLPGYWSFTNQVRKMLWQHRRPFFGLIIGAGTGFLVGALTYSDSNCDVLACSPSSAGAFASVWGAVIGIPAGMMWGATRHEWRDF